MEVKQMHFYVPKIQRKSCVLKCPKSFILLAFWYEFKHKIYIPNHKDWIKWKQTISNLNQLYKIQEHPKENC